MEYEDEEVEEHYDSEEDFEDPSTSGMEVDTQKSNQVSQYHKNMM